MKRRGRVVIPNGEHLDDLSLGALGALVKIHAAIACSGSEVNLAPVPDEPGSSAALAELLDGGFVSLVEGGLRSEVWGSWQGDEEQRSREAAKLRQRRRRESPAPPPALSRVTSESVTRDALSRVTNPEIIGHDQPIVGFVTRDEPPAPKSSPLVVSLDYDLDLSGKDPEPSESLPKNLNTKIPRATTIADSEGQGLMFPDADDVALDALVADVEQLEPLKRIKGLRAYLAKLRGAYPEIDLGELARELDVWCSTNPAKIPRKRPGAWFSAIVGKRRRERRELEARAKAEAEHNGNGRGAGKRNPADEEREARALGWTL